jgi:TfoX/Sxy family transcriptional regulator of competence genes
MADDADGKAEAVLRRIVAHFAGRAGVATARMFGSEALTTDGKVFATATRGTVVFKLPRPRVDALVAGGAERFDPGMGRKMKEWVALAPDAAQDWLALAEEAQGFVAAGARGR